MNNRGLKKNRADSALGMKPAGTFTFLLYMYFLLDFFLHFSARIPGYGIIRPTLLLVLIITISLVTQKDNFKGWTQDPIVKSLFAFLIYLAVTLPLVEWPGSVIRNNIQDFIKAIVFFFFTALIISSEKRLKIFLVVFVGCQVFRVLEPLYLHITEDYWGSYTHLGGGQFAGRLAGAPADVINPNELGFVIATVIPFLHYLMWPLNFKWKISYLFLMPAMLYALILSQSRGAFLAMLVVGWIIFRASSKKFGLIILAIIIAMAGWQVMSPYQKDRYLSLIGMSSTDNTASMEGRLEGMKKEFILGFHRPLIGHGIGTTQEAKFNLTGRYQAAHNLYSELFIEAGIIGLILFLIFLKRIYEQFQRIQMLMKDADSAGSTDFFDRLHQTLIVIFWMYVVFSLNYWGVTQYYWYLFAGIAIVFERLVHLRHRAVSAEARPAVKKGFKRKVLSGYS